MILTVYSRSTSDMLRDPVDPYDRTTSIDMARNWKARGSFVTPDPDAVRVGAIVAAAIVATAGLSAPIPNSPDQAYRIEHFGVESEPLRHPLFDGERLVRLIHNERQSSSIALAPHEAQLLVDHLVASFGLAAGGVK